MPFRSLKRGASLAPYAAVVGLVALGVSFAVNQTGDQVHGLTTKVAGSVNAVDGAISGNQGPVYDGPALSDQSLQQYDALAPLVARGFRDPEGDRLSFSLALTGELDLADLTVQNFDDGMEIAGTLLGDGSGTIAVVATDPIGRKAVAGPARITVDPNDPPVISTTPADVHYNETETVQLTFNGVFDPDDDDLTPSVTGLPGATSEIVGTDLNVSAPASIGTHQVTVEVTDDHGLITSAGPVQVDVFASSCRMLHAANVGAETGPHTLAPAGSAGTPFGAFCDMDRNGGGWTLVLKANSDPTLRYHSPYWTDSSLLNPADLTLDSGNAKYRAFTDLPSRQMRACLDGYCFGQQMYETRTALEIFQDPPTLVTYHPSSFGAGPQWSTQPNCKRYGANHPMTARGVRFGFSANQENDCDSNDTAIGIGLGNGYPAGSWDQERMGAGFICSSTMCSRGNVNQGARGTLWVR